MHPALNSAMLLYIMCPLLQILQFSKPGFLVLASCCRVLLNHALIHVVPRMVYVTMSDKKVAVLVAFHSVAFVVVWRGFVWNGVVW